MNPEDKITGVTLLEVMLVLAIMVSFLLLGLKQYQQFQLEASFIDIKKNVDILFQAMGRYYQANCRVISDAAVATEMGSSPTPFPGSLSPGGTLANYTRDSTSVTTIYIESELPPYLPKTWPTSVPGVDTSEGYKGYLLGFILTKKTKNAYQCWWHTDVSSVERIVSCSPTPYNPIQPNQVATFLIIVAVKIADDPTGDKTKVLLGATGANCASSSPYFCDGSDTPNYLIWEQLPTKSGSRINSDLWISSQREASFNQQYTHDPMYEMANPNYADPHYTDPKKNDYYYLCGS